MFEGLTLGSMAFVCGVVCAKWALDLGFSQMRQIVFFVGALLFGPLILLALYVYLVRKARKEGLPGGRTA